MRAISKSIELGGKIRQIYREVDKYVLSLERLIDDYRREDPPPTPQLVILATVIEYISTTG